jgi:Domain of unknown function (DUF1771)
MARAFEESHAAYARKDGAAAKELSNEGKAHQREMERLNAEASAWIFRGESFVHSFFYLLVLVNLCHASFEENNRVRVPLSTSHSPLYDFEQHAFRTAIRGKLIYMGSTSRRLSRTLTKALPKHEREAIGRFVSSSVRILP